MPSTSMLGRRSLTCCHFSEALHKLQSSNWSGQEQTPALALGQSGWNASGERRLAILENA